MIKTKNAVQIGAGNIGRGLNGYVLNKNNYHITFLDVSKPIIDLINETDTYQINEMSVKQNTHIIQDFNGINIIDEFEQSAKAISNASVVMISIGVSNLPKIKKLIQNGIMYKKENQNLTPLNIMAVENALNASDILKELIIKDLDSETLQFIDKYISFPSCAVDRIVPDQENQNLDVDVEEFYELVINQTKWLGEKLEFVSYTSSLTKFIERKLFMFNATHATIAWFGVKNNKYKYIYQYVDNKEITLRVDNLLIEFSKILNHKHGFTELELAKYGEKIKNRLANNLIKDNVSRVGRGIIRKIGPTDRFMTPLIYAIENNLPNEEIKKSIALAYSGLSFDDVELNELNQFISKDGLESAIKKYSGIRPKNILEYIHEEINKINNL